MTAIRWPEIRVNELRDFAARKLAVSEIAFLMEETAYTIARKCSAEKINVVRFTKEEAAAHRADQRRRWREKDEKKRQRRKCQVLQRTISGRPGLSKTSPVYRSQLGKAPVLTKSEMIEDLRQAVLNTQGARA